LQFVFATPVVLWAGWPFFVRGWRSLLTRNLNMFTLIAMGTGVAWLYSVIAVGDRLRVRPGEKVPVDGKVVEGRSSVDESMVTGESMPVTKEIDSKVIAGTLNTYGGFVMRAEKVGRD